MKENSCYCCW